MRLKWQCSTMVLPSSGISVTIQILSRLPNGIIEKQHSSSRAHNVHPTRQQRRNYGSKRRYTYDEHATAYISSNAHQLWESLLPSPALSKAGGVPCRLGRSMSYGELWVPVILKKALVPLHGDDFTSCDQTIIGMEKDDSRNHIIHKDCMPTIFIPPCLAATLGLHQLNHTSSIAYYYLRQLPTCEIAHASHATLREIGCPPPTPKLKWPITSSSGESGADTIHEEKQLRQFFLSPPRSITINDDTNTRITNNLIDPTGSHSSKSIAVKSKPRQRLLALGSIFAVPSSHEEDAYNDCDDVDCGSKKNVLHGPNEVEMMIRNVRFYQIVNIQSSRENNNDTHTQSFTKCMEQQFDGDNVDAKKRDQNNLAYILSPSTHLVLLPPNYHHSKTMDHLDDDDDDDPNSYDTKYDDNKVLHPQLGDEFNSDDYSWRLPRPSTVISFLRSILLNQTPQQQQQQHLANHLLLGTDNVNIDDDVTNMLTLHHPSAQALVDAFYLQGRSTGRISTPLSVSRGQCHICHSKLSETTTTTSTSSFFRSSNYYVSDLPIIHIIGKEENYVRACVDEAADIMGMRSFHVEGLAAFWVHYSLFHTYTQPKLSDKTSSSVTSILPTGGLSDKLRGLSASLDIARQSAPCVLHVVDVDHELSPADGPAADLDVRKDEERRMIEVIRESCYTLHGRRNTTAYLETWSSPPVIVVISTSQPLPPGPLSSLLLQSSIEISIPDINYARILWDNNVDGTFESLSSYLMGLSAREIRYLRESFVPLWKNENDCPLEKSSPRNILESLLPRLDTWRSLMKPSEKDSSSSIVPLSSSSIPNVRWEDIGGLESTRKEIMDVVELPLKYPHYFEGSRRSGILLFGPPGTGKTLVAKAIARECGLPFLSVKGPELLGSYVGESEANIRGVFEAARSTAVTPISSWSTNGISGGSRKSTVHTGASILFFDEIDSLAPRRGNTGHGDGVMDRVVATLLSELDNCGGGSNGRNKSESCSAHVVVIGATNRPDLLDPSLLRPGRFDRLLYLGPAKTKEHCLKILLAQTRKFRFEEGCSATSVLERAMESFPPTLSGADLSAVASGALMRGLKRVCNAVEEEARSRNLENGFEEGSDMAFDIDDVMESWPSEKMQPVLISDDFIEAAKKITPSISSDDLDRFEKLQQQFCS